jgi:hypothetical protein
MLGFEKSDLDEVACDGLSSTMALTTYNLPPERGKNQVC